MYHKRFQSALMRISHSIIGAIENSFYWYGKLVATYPHIFIILSLVLTGISTIGLAKFQVENSPYRLWMSQKSDFIQVLNWQKETLPYEFRLHVAVYEADNVLDKEPLLELLRVHKLVQSTSITRSNGTERSVSWKDVCAKLPSARTGFLGRKKRFINLNDIDDENLSAKQQYEPTNEIYEYQSLRDPSNGPSFSRRKRAYDWSTILPRDAYCSLLETVEMECFENSILEVWGYDETTIKSLTQEQIIDQFNSATKSVIFGHSKNFTDYLSGIERDKYGRIVKAKAMMHIWITKVNMDQIAKGDSYDDYGSAMHVDMDGFLWEQQFIDEVLNETSRPNSITFYLRAASSFATISDKVMMSDALYLLIGFVVVFFYIQIMLGKFNAIECRPVLSFLGLTAVMLAVLVSYGLASILDMKFGPVNHILPFLLLGLGIDDMFVIMQAFDNLTPEEKKQKALPLRIASTMKHAGLSITVTSATDVVAFAIGGTTDIPGLRSFCVFAAIGVAAVYFFQATYFVAWLTYDQRRLEDNRNGLFWFWKMKDFQVKIRDQKSYLQVFFNDVYSKYLLKPAVKATVILVTLTFFSFSCWGLSNLRQEFKLIWLLPETSYLNKFYKMQNDHFQTSGVTGVMYFGNISLYKELPNIEKIVNKLETSPYIGKVNSWYSSYKTYFEDQGYPVPDPDITYETFQEDLSTFLHSPAGAQYRMKNFKFATPLNCTEAAPQVIASSIDFKYNKLQHPSDRYRGMETVKTIAKHSNITGFVKGWSRVFGPWETDKIIERELRQNLSLAVLVVFLMTLVLLASVTQSMLVMICVVMTLVDVGALMHWWGLTIETASCVFLVLAIGLCVDYAAHIGHTFMTCSGDRDSRARATLARIGPAVLSGGFSTFLAFVFLANSDSHVFKTFFRIFFGVCVFGLHHGLVFLPVVLSLIGPDPYPQYATKEDTKDHSPDKDNVEAKAMQTSKRYDCDQPHGASGTCFKCDQPQSTSLEPNNELTDVEAVDCQSVLVIQDNTNSEQKPKQLIPNNNNNNNNNENENENIYGEPENVKNTEELNSLITPHTSDVKENKLSSGSKAVFKQPKNCFIDDDDVDPQIG